jgi:hypothetical protein
MHTLAAGATRALCLFGVLAGLGVGKTYAQEFEGFEGSNNVFEGDGGSRKNVDGIDFWTNGAPPAKFALLGYISDRRHKSGLVGKIRMSGLEHDVAEKVRAVGGDAVILVDSEAETVAVGHWGSSSSRGSAQAFGNSASATSQSHGTAFSRPIQKQVTRFAVIKYLPPDAAPSSQEPDSTGGPSDTSLADELEKLSGLRDRGILTQDEFEAAKQRLLRR